MKKKLFAFVLLASTALPLSSCGQSSGKSTVLRLLNLEDYIYVQDLENGYDEPDLVEQFAQYISDDPVLSEKYGEVLVVYDTTDTNESMYSEMQTGKSAYDLVCTSDYMLQKLVTYDLIQELDFSLIPNYSKYASDEIKSRLDNIEAKRFSEDTPTSLGNFAVGYMWGTLGILFNPDFNTFQDRELSREKIFHDLSEWDVFWNSDYSKTISIKDSMRDTYAMGIMYAYRNELLQLKNQYEQGLLTSSEYNAHLSDIFNRCEEENVNDVKNVLNALKDNIFGLEVDSGKQDIVTGKIGINLAWSGDAVYSIDQAEDPTQVGENIQEIYYSIPELGSNIWFDAWAMPNIERSEEQRDLAHEFLNFICDPVYASKNMDYNGYTPFIAGDSILELTRDWYDVRTNEIYQEIEVAKNEYEYYSVFAINVNEEPYEIGYDDLISTKHETMMDSWLLYYWIPESEEDESIDNNELFPVTLEDDSHKTYGDLTLVDIESLDPYTTGIEVVDLSYFFQGTLDEYSSEDMLFYSDCYLPIWEEKENGEVVHNISVGRQFFTQFPDQATINRCVVMRDFGKNNETVMRMWESFKSNPLPQSLIILFVIEIVLIVGGILFFVINKNIKMKLRKKRKALLK